MQTQNRLVDMVCGVGGGRSAWDEWREDHGSVYTAVCKTDNQGEFAVCLKEL